MRCSIITLLDNGYEKTARKEVEKIFKLAINKKYGMQMLNKYGINIFSAIPHHEGFCEKFKHIRLPQMNRKMDDALSKLGLDKQDPSIFNMT